MLQGANSTSKAVAKTKLANIKNKNARACLANITMLFPPDTTWRRGWSYVQQLPITVRKVSKYFGESMPPNPLKLFFVFQFASIIVRMQNRQNSIGIEIKEQDISIAHRLPQKPNYNRRNLTKPKPATVIARFTNRSVSLRVARFCRVKYTKMFQIIYQIYTKIC